MFYFQGSSGVSLPHLVNLKGFGRFYPGLKINDAIERFGQPSLARSDDSRTVAIYELRNVRIEVEDYSYNSIFTAHRRAVFAYPKDPAGSCTKASSILNPSVLHFVPMNGIILIILNSSPSYIESC